ncbi:MarR family winged helix-turn-helix transcriptional regulator [Streptomyces sp. NPDC015220]|uniref:MarR family winged helix-turn-helix transcriptional regulator n=1 Tax=Streptomyces sp. NPDC015220 TaxID=3364947 RepID=UPI0037035CCB
MKDECPADVVSRRLGFLLKHAFLELAAELDAALAPFRLIPRELGVLAVIDASGEQPSQLEIAARLGVDRTTMVGVIDSLEEKGYVERRRSDRDRRRNVVTLTPAGQACVGDAERARERVERDFLAPLDEAAAEALTSALLTLNRARAGAGRAGAGDRTRCEDRHGAKTCGDDRGSGMPDPAPGRGV